MVCIVSPLRRSVRQYKHFNIDHNALFDGTSTCKYNAPIIDYIPKKNLIKFKLIDVLIT